MALAKKPLRAGVGDLLTIINGNGSENIEIGSTAILTVDHSLEAEFSLATPPIFMALAGVIFRGLLTSNGNSFQVEISNISYEGIINYSWERRGIL